MLLLEAIFNGNLNLPEDKSYSNINVSELLISYSVNEIVKAYDCFYHITWYSNIESIKNNGLIPHLNPQYKGIIDVPFICLFPESKLLDSMGMFVHMSDEDLTIWRINSNYLLDKNCAPDCTHDFYKSIDNWEKLPESEKIKKSIEIGGSVLCLDPIPYDELQFLSIKFSKASLRKLIV